MPQLDFGSFSHQLAWLAFCFSCIYIIMHYWFLPVISGNINKREQDIHHYLTESERLFAEQRKSEQMIAEIIEQAKNSAREIKAKAYLEAEDLKKQMLQEFSNSLNGKLSKDMERMARLTAMLENEVQDVSASLSQELALIINSRYNLETK